MEPAAPRNTTHKSDPGTSSTRAAMFLRAWHRAPMPSTDANWHRKEPSTPSKTLTRHLAGHSVSRLNRPSGALILEGLDRTAAQVVAGLIPDANGPTLPARSPAPYPSRAGSYPRSAERRGGEERR